jgi:RNA polymerase sigma-70 factor (ECF subfamily)
MPTAECPVAALLEEHRPRLLACIARRMPPDLGARASPEDLLQDTYQAAVRDYDRFLTGPPVAPFVWLYRQAMDCVHAAWRAATAARRDVRREDWQPDLSSLGLVPVETATGPLSAAQRAEVSRAVHEVLDGLDPKDREVLLLHALDQLTHAEVGQLLGLSTTGAATRYVRALKAFKRGWQARFPHWSL